MRQPILLLRGSIRTVLFTVLTILGGWGMVASVERIHHSLQQYRQNNSLAEWSRIAAQLLTATQHLAFERGRTTVVLRSLEPISVKDRAFLDERRSLAEVSLHAAIADLQGILEFRGPDLLKKWEMIKALRLQVDRQVQLPKATRDPDLAGQWFAASSELLRSLQRATEELIGHFDPGEDTTRLTLLAAFALDLRITAGVEASSIAQAASAGLAPASESLALIYSLRGREEKLWEEIERRVGYLDIVTIKNKVREIREQQLTVFRPLQDQVLSDLAAKRKISLPLEKLTTASLQVLDGISTLMTMTTEIALHAADRGKIQARTVLIRYMVWAASLLVLLLVSFHYIVRKVVEPIESVDRELKRLGALPLTDGKGNEIDRLTASTGELAKSLIQRDEAEAVRKRTIKELQVALEQIKTLTGFLPICSSCKKIRDDKGYWEQVEAYISKYTDARFTHGICPECAQKHYAEFMGPEKINEERE